MRKLFVILAVVLAFTAALSLRQVNAGAGTRQPQKWALMVGVNDYVAERIPDLRGCRNDVELMKSVLVQKYAFPENHIRLLFDRDATKERILAEMDNWVKASSGLYDDWTADMDKRGLNGKQLLQDARDLLVKYKK